jgi:hypothetical protein
MGRRYKVDFKQFPVQNAAPCYGNMGLCVEEEAMMRVATQRAKVCERC